MDINDFFPENEQPLDKLISSGGFCGIFSTVACIGDSLASGEFEAVDEKGDKSYHDMFRYSWGQFMAREAGFTAYNFSRGGMTAAEYMNGFAADNGLFDKEKAAQAYIIALGVNDLYNGACPQVGKIEDCETGKKTFAGYYGRLVKAYKGISPDAKFFFVTFPREHKNNSELIGKAEAHRRLLYDFADYFGNSYVIDLWKYAPEYDEEFHRRFFMGGHMSPAGYAFTAKLFLSYIDYIIRHNMDDFKQVGFIGAGIKNAYSANY